MSDTPPPPPTMPDYEQLTARMVGIGLAFAAEPDVDADIESTLVFASVSGVDHDSLRTLAVLTTWLGVHHSHLDADRLIRLVAEQPSPRVRAYWAAIARWLKKDRRLARLESFYDGAPIELLMSGTAFQIARRGEDVRFVGSKRRFRVRLLRRRNLSVLFDETRPGSLQASPAGSPLTEASFRRKNPFDLLAVSVVGREIHAKLHVPAGTLRDRAEDVLPPHVLVRRHAGYRNRVLMGPSFRADVWTVMEKEPDLSVADIARRAACGFATAWQAAADFRVLRGGGA